MKSPAPARKSIRLPTYVNVWNGGYGSNDNFDLFDRPGETYPSGGAVSHMLDLWKANAPDINAIASDIYHQSPMNYRMILDRYTRPDNPLLIVETGRPIAARFFFYALADYLGHRLRSLRRGRRRAGLAPTWRPSARTFAS